MEPVEWMMLASAAVSATGMVIKGENQAQALEQQAKTQDYNAQVGYAQAEQQRAAGSQQEQQIRSLAQRQLGSGFAAAAQSGTRGGTTSGVIGDIAVQGELDAQNARFNADERARATYIGAQQAGYAAKVARSQEGPARWGADVAAGGAMVGASGKIYSQIQTSSPTIE